MRKYRLYRFSYVIIPRTDIPILNNKIILPKTRKPAVIIHIRQSPEKKDQILSFAKFFRFTIKVMFSSKPYKYTTSRRRNQVFQPFFPTVFRLYTLIFSRTGLCFIERQTSILIASSWQASYYCIRFIKKYRCTRTFDFIITSPAAFGKRKLRNFLKRQINKKSGFILFYIQKIPNFALPIKVIMGRCLSLNTNH